MSEENINEDPYSFKKGSITIIRNFHPGMADTIHNDGPYFINAIKLKNSRVCVGYSAEKYVIELKKLVKPRTILLTQIPLSPEATVSLFELLVELLHKDTPSPKPEGFIGIGS